MLDKLFSTNLVYREFIHLTKHFPFTKFWLIDRMKDLFREPILDLGCSRGETFWYAKMSGDFTGVDFFEPYLKIAKDRGIYNATHCKDLTELDDGTIDFSRFNTVTAFHVLEHLEFDETQHLLDVIERIGEFCIIMVPYGVCPQETVEGNIGEKHLSFYMPPYFEKRGYHVHIYHHFTVSRGLTVFPKGIFAYRRNHN